MRSQDLLSSRLVVFALTLTLAGCRPSAGYDSAPLTSSNQWPPVPWSVAGSGGATQLTPPPQGVPGDVRERPAPAAAAEAPAGHETRGDCACERASEVPCVCARRAR